MLEFKHFFLTNTATSEKYTATGGGSGTFRSPPRDSREGHGKKLVEGFEKVREAAASREQAAEPNVEGLVFVPLAIEGEVGELNNRKYQKTTLGTLPWMTSTVELARPWRCWTSRLRMHCYLAPRTLCGVITTTIWTQFAIASSAATTPCSRGKRSKLPLSGGRWNESSRSLGLDGHFLQPLTPLVQVGIVAADDLNACAK